MFSASATTLQPRPTSVSASAASLQELLASAINENNMSEINRILSPFNELNTFPSEIIETMRDALMRPNPSGCAPSLHLEIKKAFLEILLKQDGFNINEPIKDGYTLRDVAVTNADTDFEQTLKKKGATWLDSSIASRQTTTEMSNTLNDTKPSPPAPPNPSHSTTITQHRWPTAKHNREATQAFMALENNKKK